MSYAAVEYPAGIQPTFLARSGGGTVYKVHSRDAATGQGAYYVIRVPALKDAAFRRAIASQLSLDLAEYGEILSSGFSERDG